MALSYKPMHGILVATMNPYKKAVAGSLDPVCVNLEPIEEYAEYLRSSGASGVFVCGTTGDYSILSMEERMQLQSGWLQSKVRNKFEHVIVHIGSQVWSEMIALGKHACEQGASAVCVTFPSFPHHAPKTASQFIHYLSAISHALPNIPLLVYNIEGATPPQHLNNLYPLLNQAIQQNSIPTFKGVKYTSANFIDAYDLVSKLNIDVAIGCDEKMLPAYSMGFESFIGSTYNVFCDSFVKVKSLMDDGKVNESKELFNKLFLAIRLLCSRGYFKLNQRVATNRVLEAKCGFSLGNETKYYYISTEENLKIANEVCDELWEKFPELFQY